MSDKKVENPPAFPKAAFYHEHGGTDSPQEGLSLRDYFAAKAMASMFAGDGAQMVANLDGRYDETNWTEIVSLNAYEIADAMLKERSKEL